jgi:hypothetical protein
MFKDNKYSKWYHKIIDNAKHRTTINGYIERHHIIPKSLGGLDGANNIVSLTAREHFVCHFLLTKMTQGTDRRKMLHAAWRMINFDPNCQDRYIVSSRIYERIKEQNAKALSSSNTGRPSGRKGKPCTWGDKISQALKGHKPTAERNAKVSKSLTGRKRPIRNEEWMFNLRSSIAKNSRTCEQCGKIINQSAYTRWHGPQCQR